MPANPLEQRMKFEKVRGSLIFIAVLFIVSIICVVFWDVVRDQIIIPLYYLVWVGGLILKSISQKVFLVLLVIGCLIIGASTIKNLRLKGSQKASEKHTTAITSRYRFWSKLLSHSLSSEFFRWEFALEARKLIFSIFSFQEGIDPEEAELRIKRRELPVPEVVKLLVEKREISVEAPIRNWAEIWIQKILQLFSIQEPRKDQSGSKQIEEIIHFIEDRLEITHDGNHP
jgi:hypothetical protein